jgi:non-specific serine/threonine protein kinase
VETPRDGPSFAELLRRHRVEAKLTQEELAGRSGLSARGIQKLEAGHSRPYHDTATRLAAGLGLDGKGQKLFLVAAQRSHPRRQPDRPTADSAGSRNSDPTLDPDLPPGPTPVASGSWSGRSRTSERDGAPNNLPITLTRFIGRQREVAEAQRLLRSTRLLTLTGTGGCGKTRLALELARIVLDAYPDGAWFVDLAPLRDAALVVPTILTSLGLRALPGRSPMTTLIDFLRPRRLLLLLDNCEHLVSGCAPVVDAIVRACSTTTVLATSREILGVEGETAWRVPSLGLPDRSRAPSLDAVVASESAQLFLDRARLIAPSFEASVTNVAALAETCHRLDGIPLALELAAAQVRVLSVGQIADRLDDRFRFLVSTNRQALPRQQTLRAVIDWSYDLLSAGERALFRRLGIFVGDFSLAAAEQIAGTDGEDVLADLSGLVDKSLVQAETRGLEMRYRFLDTIRQYALEKLAEAGEPEAIAERHASWVLAQVRQGDAIFRAYDADRWDEAARRLEADYNDVRAALDWYAGDESRLLPGLELVGGLWRVWERLGAFREGRDWCARFLAATEGAASPARARALESGTWVAMYLEDYPRGQLLAQQAYEIWQELGARSCLPLNRRVAGLCAREAGDWPAARRIFEEGLRVAEAMGDPTGINGVAGFVDLLGTVDLAVGEFATARARLAESRAWWCANALCRAWSDHNLGCLEIDEGSYDQAQALLVASLRTFRASKMSQGSVRCLGALLALAAGVGEHQRVALLDGALSAYHATTGLRNFPTDRPRLERGIAASQRALGDEHYQRARASGQTWSLDRAIAFALREETANSQLYS